MTITVNTKDYVRDSSPNANTEVYRGPNATASVKDALLLSRTAAKPTDTFPGMAKSRGKFTRTVEYATGKYADAIIEFTSSFPVGTAEADVDALRDDMGDFLIASYGNVVIFDQKITGL
jgi:hypothetical protein